MSFPSRGVEVHGREAVGRREGCDHRGRMRLLRSSMSCCCSCAEVIASSKLSRTVRTASSCATERSTEGRSTLGNASMTNYESLMIMAAWVKNWRAFFELLDGIPPI
ncbi:hypothetical protein K439DRAFT_704455 [Ramaria rubella]|nr:hypothetical protein K439DRAFT_704455 [Ramaria rubella]